jgi:hypothetical protein
MSNKDLQAEIDKLRSEKKALEAQIADPSSVYVSEKTGSICLRVDGQGTMGLHTEKWDMVAAHIAAVVEFMTPDVRKHAAELRAAAKAAKAKAG